MWIKKSKYEEMQNELRRLRKIEKTNKENLIAWSDESREYAEYKETVIEGLERLLTHIQKGSV
jgi:soluble cytochrome b562